MYYYKAIILLLRAKCCKLEYEIRKLRIVADAQARVIDELKSKLGDEK